MNFMTQMGDGHGYTSPVSFHLRPDHFETEAHSPTPKRRHTMIGNVSDDASGHGSSRRGSHVSRPKSMALDIPLTELGSNHRAGSSSKVHNNNHNHTRTDSHVNDEALEQLLPERGENGAEVPYASDYLTPANTEYLPAEHDCEDEGCQRAIINVSGLRFETQLRTLDRLPHTLLGDPGKRRHYWDESRHEFFFDRHRPTFQAVLYYYQSGGRLKRPLEVPMDIFLNELMFYELGGAVIDSFKENEGYIVEKEQPRGPENNVLHRIWIVLEYPESSLLAKVFALLSVIFILLSVVIFCTETLPMFKDAGCRNVTSTASDGTVTFQFLPDLLDPLFLCETCCIAWFVMELALRLIVSPSKITFFRATINWIDLVAIAPYFIFLTLNHVTGDCNSGHKSSVLSVLRVLRVVRIFKLSKHSEGLKILGMTLKNSIQELFTFVLFIGIATVIFSGAIFYAELGEPNSQFTSIPDAFWWAIVSMTTVGYGDFVPRGVPGKLLGGVCVLSGVLAIALPVPVIVANFNNYYRHYTETSLRKPSTPWRHRLQHLVTCNNCASCRACTKHRHERQSRLSSARPDITLARPDITLARPDITLARPDRPNITLARPDRPDITLARPDRPDITLARPDRPDITLSRPDRPDITLARPAIPDITVTTYDANSIASSVSF